MRDDWVFKVNTTQGYDCPPSWWYAYNEGEYWKLCDRVNQSGFNTRYKRDNRPENWINTVEWHYRESPEIKTPITVDLTKHCDKLKALSDAAIEAVAAIEKVKQAIQNLEE